MSGREEDYANVRINDGSNAAKLMQYMKDTRGENPLFPKLSARVRYLKEDKKGAKAAAKSNAALLFQNGVSFDIVAKSIRQLTRKELEKIYQGAH